MKFLSLDIPLTFTAFSYLLVKASITTVSLSEVTGIFLILVVHYARHFAPQRKKISINPIEVEKAIMDIEAMKTELSKVKLALGFKTMREMKLSEKVAS